MRDFTAIKRIATAYMKLLFPQPAIARRRIIIEQCQLIYPEYSVRMPSIHVKVEME